MFDDPPLEPHQRHIMGILAMPSEMWQLHSHVASFITFSSDKEYARDFIFIAILK